MQGSCTVTQRINQLLTGTIGVIRFGSVSLLYFLWRCPKPDPLVFPMPWTTQSANHCPVDDDKHTLVYPNGIVV